MGKEKKIIVTCSNSNHICDKSQYNEATFWEKVALNIHLIFCRACRRYTSKNRKLTKSIKKSEVINKDPKVINLHQATMNQAAKDAMKDQLRREISKQQ